jgi:4,5-DOPA dioxygenase extradiol
LKRKFLLCEFSDKLLPKYNRPQTPKSFNKLASITIITFIMNNLQMLNSFLHDTPHSDEMPVLFLGHGSPMNAIEENEFVAGFRSLAENLPQPKAILCISAHWFTKGTLLTAMPNPRTIHDFGGFPQGLYAVNYPAPGNPELARYTQYLLNSESVALDTSWGLDHGCWSVIKHLYPKADVPVIQMSIDYNLSGSAHFALAQQLVSLRQKGILIVGSGNIIHNLNLIDFRKMNLDNYSFDWAMEVREKVNRYILDRNFVPLTEYLKMSRAFQLAIPTPEHFLPLIYALALVKVTDNISLFNDKMQAGSLSMTSVKITSH